MILIGRAAKTSGCTKAFVSPPCSPDYRGNRKISESKFEINSRPVDGSKLLFFYAGPLAISSALSPNRDLSLNSARKSASLSSTFPYIPLSITCPLTIGDEGCSGLSAIKLRIAIIIYRGDDETLCGRQTWRYILLSMTEGF